MLSCYIVVLIGRTELGEFKLEHENIKRGYFISSKTYCLITKDDKVHIKSKGVYKDSLKEQDFINLLLDKDVKAVIDIDTFEPKPKDSDDDDAFRWDEKNHTFIYDNLEDDKTELAAKH